MGVIQVDTTEYQVTRAWDDEELFGKSISDTLIFRHIAQEDHVHLTDMLGGSTLKGAERSVILTFLVTPTISFKAECYALSDPDDPSMHLVGLRLLQDTLTASSKSKVKRKDKAT